MTRKPRDRHYQILTLKRSSKRLHRDEHGAAIVEFALIFPLFMTLVGGVVDYGIGFRAKQTVVSAARTASRVGAAATDDTSRRYADLLILRSVYESLSSDSGTRDLTNARLSEDPSTQLEVIVYEPDPATGSMRLGCIDGVNLTTASNCNRYDLADLQAATSLFTGTSLDSVAKGNYDQNSTLIQKSGLPSKDTGFPASSCSYCWSPLARNSGQMDASGTRLYSNVGVHVRIKRKQFFASFLPVGVTDVPAQAAFRSENGNLDAGFTAPEPAPTTSTIPPSTTTTVGAPTTTTTTIPTTTAPTTTKPPTTTTSSGTTTTKPPTTTTKVPSTTTTKPTTTTTIPGGGGGGSS